MIAHDNRRDGSKPMLGHQSQKFPPLRFPKHSLPAFVTPTKLRHNSDSAARIEVADSSNFGFGSLKETVTRRLQPLRYGVVLGIVYKVSDVLHAIPVITRNSS